MTYISHIPSPPLDFYIDDLYYCYGPAPYQRLKTLPMPSLHLMVNFGHPFQVYASGQVESFATCHDSWCVGLWSEYHVVDWPLNVQFFGVHFKPGGAYPFLQLPLSQLHNRVVPLDAILGRSAAALREQLYMASSIQAGFILLERFLFDRIRNMTDEQGVSQYAIAQIARQNGVLSIRALSDQIGISQNHLGTLFKRVVGVSPKELARFYRFSHVLHSIDPTQPVDWTRIAHQSCFYDQSHFNKDFVAMTGHSPTDYLRLLRRFHTENPEQAQSPGQMLID